MLKVVKELITKVKDFIYGPKETISVVPVVSEVNGNTTILDSEVATAEVINPEVKKLSASEKVQEAVIKLNKKNKPYTPKDVAALAGVSLPTAKKYIQ